MTDLHEKNDPEYRGANRHRWLDIWRLCYCCRGHRCGGGLSWQHRDDREYPRIARRGIAG